MRDSITAEAHPRGGAAASEVPSHRHTPPCVDHDARSAGPREMRDSITAEAHPRGGAAAAEVPSHRHTPPCVDHDARTGPVAWQNPGSSRSLANWPPDSWLR